MLPASLLPDPHDWTPVDAGESGATVLRHVSGERFAKLVSGPEVETLAAERDRIEWLSRTGIPTMSVLDWTASDDGACLVTGAVPGVPADALDPSTLTRVWPAIAEITRALHALPVEECPFDRRLAVMMPLARAVVAEDRVQREFLPDELQEVSAPELLAPIEQELPVRIAQEAEDLVVCHGDLCLPNILIDVETSTVSGLIDLGRLGRGDPHADTALLLANARENWPDAPSAARADAEFDRVYGDARDQGRQDFYLRLDPLTW
ncbi:aminoglycoside 3'-phosphotransferase [Streptomyces sp. AC495_CC817]|uniref:aminoglycoside 3'-phosphotransferase n=1 Tax=Streptomyces sp. AC495_CC817 TaxID=2823900 RepID=UPI001C261948|nr:aminoglycoside 3'-phosphotransferase [Streptomyces sp. AC495_CC817]